MVEVEILPLMHSAGSATLFSHSTYHDSHLKGGYSGNVACNDHYYNAYRESTPTRTKWRRVRHLKITWEISPVT